MLLDQGSSFRMSLNKIMRIPEHLPRADQSAMCAINRHLLDDRFILWKFIIGDVRDQWLSHEKVLKATWAGKRERGWTKGTKREADNVRCYRMSLPSRLKKEATGCQAWVKFSHTCFAIADEQQAVVLVRHPDHTVGQARSTSVKPISDVVSLLKVYHFFMGRGAW